MVVRPNVVEIESMLLLSINLENRMSNYVESENRPVDNRILMWEAACAVKSARMELEKIMRDARCNSEISMSSESDACLTVS